jgi:hypothetical protein
VEVGWVTYAERILSELDRQLESPVELTLYGRAAFLLGFSDPPEQFSQSLDVDAVLWLGQAEELGRDSNFWDALDAVNSALAAEGFYMSHLFVEDQVILTPEWRDNRKQVENEWRNLDRHRLGDEDLLLSKLMRDDPQDRQDALFIVGRRGWGIEALERLFTRARVPEIAELEEQFEIASRKLIAASRSER